MVRVRLIAYRTEEPIDSKGSDGCAPAVGCGWIWSAMHHGIADLNPGGKVVENDPANEGCHSFNNGPDSRKLTVSGKQACSEMALKRRKDLQ